MPRLSEFRRILGEALAGFTAAAVGYFDHMSEVADTFRRLMPLGREGWAISTIGVTLSPEAHRAAALADDVHEAEAILQECWSDPDVQRSVCSVVPWVYRVEDRRLAERRRDLLLRASQRYADGLYEEAVLLIYSQLDGMFRDRADEGEEAYSRLFSKRRVGGPAGAARQFVDIVAESNTMLATEQEFFLMVRESMTAPVSETTLGDHPSRHGVLHGRVLGYGTRTRAAQAFAFLATCLEMLVASRDRLPMTRDEAHHTPVHDAPDGLRVLLRAKSYSPVRSVYLALPNIDRDVLVASNQEASPATEP